ncbi:MAG: acyl-CoA dehydrogenase family protein [Oceanicaulis sp.]
MSAAPRQDGDGVLARLRAAPRREDFPEPALQVMRAEGWLAPARFDAPLLFDRLLAAGRGELSAGRLLEGHVNALHLIERLGSPAQKAEAYAAARAGGLGGVWAASDPSNPARIDAQGRLSGRLGFCSGAERLAFALAAVDDAAGAKQLVVLRPERLAQRFDLSAWRTAGMAASRSAALSLHGLEIAPDARLGPPGAYHAEPFFSAGAARFAAVQAGGVLAVFDALRDHLQTTGRWRAEAQAARLSAAAAACEAMYAGVRDAFTRIAPAIDPASSRPEGAPDCWIALADGARQMVMNAAPGLMETAQASVGAGGHFTDHPLSRAVADLQMYLRQPAPDAARRRHGEQVGSGALALAFDGPGP